MFNLPLSSDNIRRTAPVVQNLERRLFLCAELHGTALSAPLLDDAAIKEVLYETAARPGPSPAPGFGFEGAFRAGAAYGDAGNAVATDDAGNTYVNGIAGTASSSAGYIAKYSPLGALLWSVSVDGRMTVDASGDVYVTGVFEGTTTIAGAPEVLTSAGGTDVFVVKLNGANGAGIWARCFGGAESETSRGIAVDATGAYYIATTAPSVTGGTAILATKFDATGNQLYSSQRAASTNATTLTNDIALDAAGGVVVVGWTHNGSPRPSFAWKLDASGGEQWDRQWAGATSSSYHIPYGVVIDGSGSVLIAGTFTGVIDFNPSPSASFTLKSRSCHDAAGGMISCIGGYGADAFVLKLNAAGNFTWAIAMGGSARGGDAANDIATDEAGNVYTAGRFYGKADFDPGAGRFDITAKGVSSGVFPDDELGVSDAFLSKLDGAGRFVWAAAVGGSNTASTGDAGNGIAVGPDRRVHATGFFRGSGDFDPTAGVRTLTSAGSGDLFVVSLSQPDSAGITAGDIFTPSEFGAARAVIGTDTSAVHNVLSEQRGDELELLLR